eukprot:2152114-Pyramimonas_sp.AAC.1
MLTRLPDRGSLVEHFQQRHVLSEVRPAFLQKRMAPVPVPLPHFRMFGPPGGPQSQRLDSP